MWPAKLEGEGAELVTACDAMCALMAQLRIAIDGGKDSLGMAAQVGDNIVKSPGTLVISAYAPCVDITGVVTPDLKGGTKSLLYFVFNIKQTVFDNHSQLIYVRFGNDGSTHRIGASAFAQCYSQLGDSSADLDDSTTFVNAFNCLQTMIKGSTF